MNTSHKTLNLLKIGEIARISELNLNGTERRRMSDLGMTVGTAIEKIFISPFGDLSAYLVRGSVIALRLNDASKISVVI